ncbi:MAG: hypothetical protein HC902_10030, partial [Calothrix sp. SM1_5_4]|nr:hypothetical protein [Calothrix sp. SM1_5_4]
TNFRQSAFALCFFLAFTAFSGPAKAHSHDDDEDFAATADLFEKIVTLTPDVLEDASSATPKVRISGVDVPLNGPFWELVRGWVRIYYKDLQKECDHCIHLTEDQFSGPAVDIAAKSFRSGQGRRAIMENIEHISNGTADLGARLGNTAFVAKATSEVAEAVLSKMIGGGGVHLFCNLIDAAIIFGTRHIQTAFRGYSWAGSMGGSRLASLARLGLVSSVVKRAQKRVRFETAPVVVNEEELRELDLEGPNRYWGLAKDGKRAACAEGFGALA